MRTSMKRVLIVCLLTLLFAVGCGDDPVPDKGSQAGVSAPQSPTPPEEPAQANATARKRTPRKRAPRMSPVVTLEVKPREAWPTSGATGLAVTLTGTVQARQPHEWDLLVCGLPAYVDDEGRFVALRSFPKAGTYVVSAVLRRPYRWRGRAGTDDVTEVLATDCQITVSTTPEETEHVRRLCADVIGADDVVDETILRELIRTRDLRTVPTLWKVIEAHPDLESLARERAVRAIGSLAHLDSVPRLIRLLTDWGVYRTAYRQVERLGLWGPDVTQWKPPPSSKNEVRTVIDRLLLVFAEQEPALRQALHQ